MKYVNIILLTILLIGIPKGSAEMETQTLVRVLNFSKSLIQTGEIKFIYYNNFLTHPVDFGKEQQKILAFREQELREVHKKPNPKALRKAILKKIEEEKKYGRFWEPDDKFTFVEADLVFQVRPGSTMQNRELDYRMYGVSRFEDYPSLDFKRFFNGVGEDFYFANANQMLSIITPNQFANGRRRGFLGKRSKDDSHLAVYDASKIPPVHFIDEKYAKVSQLETENGQKVTVITHFPIKGNEKVMAKIYVRIARLPEVIREEYYYQSESPNADANGFWLRATTDYSDFEEIEHLNLVLPKLRDEKEYRSDGFMRRRTIVTIREMVFNQGLPSGFFDWNEAELSDDKGNQLEIPTIETENKK